MSDFNRYMRAQTELSAARAELNAASRLVELRQMKQRIAEVNSQAEPLNALGLDRELVRQVLLYIQCGRLK